MNGIYLLVPNKLMIYDYEGALSKSLPLDVKWGSIRRVEKGFLIFSNTAIAGGMGLAYLDAEGNIIKTAMPLTEANSSTARIDWIEYGKSVYLHQVNRSNDLFVFDISAGEFHSTELLDFANVLSSEEYASRITTAKKLSAVDGGLLTGLTSFPSQLVWGMLENNNVSFCIYDKSERVARKFSLSELKDDATFSVGFEQMMLLGVFPYNDSDDECLISYLDAFPLKENLVGKEGKFMPDGPMLEKLSPNSNPVIVALKFRVEND